ncbi:MAG: hypothetical protein NC393_04135 [Clostridium sp.]|nr:hypothetical protein [Clostridium sp.]MCM1208962.1 hypothetical protein [Ruminococcus sp.]
MRLIDAGKLKSNFDITNWDEPYGCSFKRIDEQPTAFDLEKAVEQLTEKVRHADAKAAECDEKGDITMMTIWDTKAKSYRNALEILKSVTEF